MSDLLTVSEVADILRVHPATVRRWIKQGVLEVVILSHSYVYQLCRIKRETISKFMGNK